MSIDSYPKHHNAPDKYPTMHHFVTEMCTHVHISVTKRCIVGYGTGTPWEFLDLIYCVERLDIISTLSHCTQHWNDLNGEIFITVWCTGSCHDNETKMSRWQKFSSLGAPKVVILTTWRKFCQHDIFVLMNDAVNRRWHRHNCFRRWFVACSVPGHFQIQRWIIFPLI